VAPGVYRHKCAPGTGRTHHPFLKMPNRSTRRDWQPRDGENHLIRDDRNIALHTKNQVDLMVNYWCKWLWLQMEEQIWWNDQIIIPVHEARNALVRQCAGFLMKTIGSDLAIWSWQKCFVHDVNMQVADLKETWRGIYSPQNPLRWWTFGDKVIRYNRDSNPGFWSWAESSANHSTRDLHAISLVELLAGWKAFKMWFGN
jgi:hypothetical protein